MSFSRGGEMGQILTGSGLAGLLRYQRVRTRSEVSSTDFLYLCLGAVLVMVLVLFVYLWSRVAVVHLGYEISGANAERSVLLEKKRRLSVELMELHSPGRIERIASGELGLIHPSAEQIVRIK
ncbi:MAG: cell division protein FtsL [Thermodesulfobacteriota bacterium]